MASYPITIETGVTWTETFVWKDDEGNRVPLTGMAAKMQARAKPFAPVLFEISSGEGTIELEETEVDGSAVGVIKLTVPGPKTAAIRMAEAEYDVKLTTAAAPDGEPSVRWLKGPITFDLGVTQ